MYGTAAPPPGTTFRPGDLVRVAARGVFADLVGNVLDEDPAFPAAGEGGPFCCLGLGGRLLTGPGPLAGDNSPSPFNPLMSPSRAGGGVGPASGGPPAPAS